MRGLIKGESLLDGSVSLAYIALLNEAIDVDLENQYRHRQYMKSKEERNV
jgi:hypothetical protein